MIKVKGWSKLILVLQVIAWVGSLGYIIVTKNWILLLGLVILTVSEVYFWFTVTKQMATFYDKVIIDLANQKITTTEE
jgi:hypothetical protein